MRWYMPAAATLAVMLIVLAAAVENATLYVVEDTEPSIPAVPVIKAFETIALDNVNTPF